MLHIENGKNHNYGVSEYNGGLVIGVTPEFRVTKRLVFMVDVTILNNFRQHLNWDGAYSDNSNNLSGQMVSASAGLSYAIGKRKNFHQDFNIIEDNKNNDSEVKALDNKVSKLEKMMQDTDRDGVPDYLDAENNSVNGVAVDSKGRMIDLNRNGVPDELERGKDGMNGINSAIVSKEDAINSLIDKGFVNIFYDVNKDEPNIGSTNNVYYLIKFLRAYPDSKATLTGFADLRGDEAANKDLSNRRAQKLLKIFKDSGIAESRIIVTGDGVDKSFPDSKIGLDLARRVSVTLQ
jgi:OOP family OmpA-OmpF porin